MTMAPQTAQTTKLRATDPAPWSTPVGETKIPDPEANTQKERVRFKGTASIKMREIDPSHVKEILPARW